MKIADLEQELAFLQAIEQKEVAEVSAAAEELKSRGEQYDNDVTQFARDPQSPEMNAKVNSTFKAWNHTRFKLTMAKEKVGNTRQQIDAIKLVLYSPERPRHRAENSPHAVGIER